MRRRHAPWGRVLGAGLLVLGLGCTDPGWTGEALAARSARMRQLAPASQHAVHAARLAEVMGGLERFADDHLSRALDAPAHERAEMAKAARALADTAARIPDVVPDLDLEPAEREEFLFLARVLQRRAQTLAEEAPHLEYLKLHERSQELRRTCDHCHGRYRIPTAHSSRREVRPGRG